MGSALVSSSLLVLGEEAADQAQHNPKGLYQGEGRLSPVGIPLGQLLGSNSDGQVYEGEWNSELVGVKVVEVGRLPLLGLPSGGLPKFDQQQHCSLFFSHPGYKDLGSSRTM